MSLVLPALKCQTERRKQRVTQLLTLSSNPRVSDCTDITSYLSTGSTGGRVAVLTVCT